MSCIPEIYHVFLSQLVVTAGQRTRSGQKLVLSSQIVGRPDIHDNDNVLFSYNVLFNVLCFDNDNVLFSSFCLVDYISWQNLIQSYNSSKLHCKLYITCVCKIKQEMGLPE